MALVSPGVEVTVIDESQYIPSAVNTVPYFVVATAQNKVSSDGITVAAGTLAANANKTYLITSQRDLAATFGVPFFYNTTTGTPINGYELNEYGLLAAYSSLGITNRCYVQRANIDLSELTASLVRPTGNPNDGDYWLDTSTSVWGIQEWNQTTNTFTVKTPIVITDTADVVNFSAGNYTPNADIGSIGDYAISAVATSNPGYYKNASNAWVLVGGDAWKASWPTITGTGTPTSLTAGNIIVINGTTVTVSATNTLAQLSTDINAAAIPGVTSSVVSSKLQLTANSLTTPDISSLVGGAIDIDITSTSALLLALGIPAGVYYAPTYLPSYSYQAPRWAVGQPVTATNWPSPTGSVWNNMSAANSGVALRIKKYSAALGTFVSQTTSTYANLSTATYTLDPSGGGKNIPVGTTIAIWNAIAFGGANPFMALEILERNALGPTVITGSDTTPGPFVNGSTFRITGTQIDGTSQGANVTISGTSTASFITAVSSANITNVSASVNSSGAIVLTHSAGGNMSLLNLTGTPVTLAGFTVDTPGCLPSFTTANALTLSNWVTTPEFTYTASTTEPDQDPVDGRLWYYSTVSDADIMIQNDGSWVGYQTVTNDVRGYDLSDTNAKRPFLHTFYKKIILINLINNLIVFFFIHNFLLFRCCMLL